jgi:hypothetical protein
LVPHCLDLYQYEAGVMPLASEGLHDDAVVHGVFEDARKAGMSNGYFNTACRFAIPVGRVLRLCSFIVVEVVGWLSSMLRRMEQPFQNGKE